MIPFDPIHELPTSTRDAAAPVLLVSVRCEQELVDALGSTVDIIDLKEPRHGPLAPASQTLWDFAARMWEALGPIKPTLSAALGESDQAKQVAAGLPGSFAFAKAGPSGCNSRAALERLWRTVHAQLDDATSLVAVAYADHDAAECMPPADIFRCAGEAGIQWCLLDTFRKDGRSSLDHLGYDAIQTLQQVIAESDQWWALAGSLRAEDVLRFHSEGIMPNCFGVRGDVCDGNRTGKLSAEKIAIWKTALATIRPTPSRSG